MKIKEPTSGYKVVDIGPLDVYWRIEPPLPARVIAMRSCVCAACRKRFVLDEVMIVGFKDRGMRLHERCWDGTGVERGATESEEAEK